MKPFPKFQLLILVAAGLIFSNPIAWAMGRKPKSVEPSSIPQVITVKPPLSLEDCFALALKQSESLAIKGVEIEKSFSDFLLATDDAIGDFKFVKTDFYQEDQDGGGGGNSDVGGSFTRSHSRTSKFVISQPIFQGFKSLGALAGAGSLKSSRVYDRKRAEQLLFLDVSNSFYSVLRYEKDLQIQQEVLKLFQERVKELESWEEIGKSRLSEVVSAKNRMNTIMAEIAKAEGTLALEKRVLEFLTGVSMDNRPLLDNTTLSYQPATLESYLPEAITRFDVASAEEYMKTKKRNILIKQSRLWPTISLDNNLYEKREGFQSGIDWDLTVTMDVPIFQGGGAIGETKQAYSEWKQSKLTYQQKKRQAEMEIKQAYDTWQASQKQFLALEEALKTAEENYTLQKDDYKKNLVSNLEVLQALEQLNQNKKDTNQVYFELKENYWQLEVARGNCCELT